MLRGIGRSISIALKGKHRDLKHQVGKWLGNERKLALTYCCLNETCINNCAEYAAAQRDNQRISKSRELKSSQLFQGDADTEGIKAMRVSVTLNGGRRKLRPNLQLVAALMEDPGGAEQHRGVRVVAAGVHLLRLLALVLPLHLLLIHKIWKRV